MSDVNTGSGSCLCGSVRFTTETFSANIGACHCSICRKWGGGPSMSIDCGTEVSFEGEENISIYDSSDWADRGFCKQCGSHLFYRLKQNQQYIMAAGLFDDDSKIVFDHQVFIEEKPAYYDFANETKNMTGAELFAQFAPPDD